MRAWGIALVALVALLAPSGVGAQPVADAAPQVAADGVLNPSGPVLSRLQGATRYETSAKISAHRFADPSAASVVYLARGDLFADALAAGALSDGPVLLVPSCRGVPSGVAAEIDRLDPGRVIALGGTQAVCPATLAAAADGRPAARIGGEGRYATAALIAERAYPGGSDRVYLAKGENSPDAVVGGTLTDGPVLLADKTGASVPAATKEAVAALDAEEVVALGGAVAVSDGALTTAAAGRSTGRLAGADRYATAVAVAEHAYPGSSSRAYLARGDGRNYVDAVAAGVLTDGPVLLAHGPCTWLPRATEQHLADVDPGRVVALGGTGALCDTVLRQASRAVAPPTAPSCASVKCVALTFDDGPSSYTPRLIDTLLEENVPATFFLVGQMAAARPQTAQLLAMEGFQVGNHTWSHPQMNLLSLTQQRRQVADTNDVLNSRGIPDATMMRPPYGSYDSNTRRLGVPLILWSVDPRDWEASSTTSGIRTHIRTHVFNGAIVLQHDTHGKSVDAVPGTISDLRAQGYHFVTVEQLVPGAGPGDLVYSRGQITRSGSSLAPESREPRAPESDELEQLRDEAPAPDPDAPPLP